ncbi:MAG TPA: hypothetical protein VN258_16865 [Mobilitalea sp.]|nr:hypothetical protein [Mobilitalea sp.]
MDKEGCCNTEANSKKQNIQKIIPQSVNINKSTNSGGCCCGDNTCGE